MTSTSCRGLFLTFEGLDGSGKTTQIKLLGDWLSNQDIPHIVTRQPGGTATGDRIRELLLNSKSAGITPHTELAMMFADRAQAIHEVIAPALELGKLVICDRFTDSTEAYQGGGRELGSEVVRALHRLLCGDLQPDLTLLLLSSLDASLRRARRRNDMAVEQTGTDENRFESEKDPFFERVQRKYREIASRDKARVVQIDGDLTIEQVHQQVVDALTPRLRQFRFRN